MSDEDGRTFIEKLGERGVDISFVKLAEGQTGLYGITLVDAGGERTMLSSRGASANVPELTEKLKSKLRSADMLYHLRLLDAD